MKPSDAKTLDMHDEYWRLLEDMLPILQPVQVVTALLSAESMPSSSVIYPMLQKPVTVDLAENAADSAVIRSFKADLKSSIDDRFQLSNRATSDHPFVTATVLDPATKSMPFFPEEFRSAAYQHVCVLLESASASTASTQASTSNTDVDEEPEDANPPPVKCSRTASLKFISQPAAPPQSDFDRYLLTPVDDIDALHWWSSTATYYPSVSAPASRYLSVPATSAQSERQFSAAGRLISKIRSRLDGHRVDTLLFLYKNM